MTLTPWRARLVLLALLLIALSGVVGHQTIAPPPRDRSTSIGDINLQLVTIERLQTGEPYYSAVGGELRKHGYPTSPVVNWRTPLHYKTMAWLSIDRAAKVLYGLAMIVIITGALAYARTSPAYAIAAAVLLLAAMAPALLIRSMVGFPEIWAGALIGLSLNAYTAGLRLPASVLGVLAVFVRELAAPYALVCGIIALRQRRRVESSIWIIGGLVYTIYYVAHAAAASAAIQPGDLVREGSYAQFLGVSFVFKTLYTYGALTLLPPFATAIAASLGLAAVFSRSAVPQLAPTVVVYFVLFCLVGQAFNFYWGYLTVAIWAHAFLHSPSGLATLLKAALPREDEHHGARCA